MVISVAGRSCIACSSIGKTSKTAHKGKRKRQTSVFNAGAAIPCPCGPTAQPRFQVSSGDIQRGQEPLFPGARAFFLGRGRCKAQGMRRWETIRRLCRFPAFLASQRRAPVPRAGGGRVAVRFGRSGAKDGFDGRMGEMTLPCPAGARGAAGVRIRRCSPLRGEGASELARLILVCRGERAFAERSVLQELFGRRAGKRKTGRRRPFRGVFPRMSLRLSRIQRKSLLPGRSFPLPSRGENGGLCPHPLKGPDP